MKLHEASCGHHYCEVQRTGDETVRNRKLNTRLNEGGWETGRLDNQETRDKTGAGRTGSGSGTETRVSDFKVKQERRHKK